MSPSVGVVVPCKDEVATVRLCLESLRAQTPPVSVIVVVDNGSTDGSRELAASLADHVVDLPGVPISTLRNTGAAHLARAGVEVLGFVDADCELAPGWLRAGLTALEDFDMVGSRTLAADDATWVAARWAAIEKARSHGQSFLWSQHLLVKRQTFEELNGFDESMPTGEDADLSARLRSSGGRISLRDDMVVRHHGFPRTLRRFLRREIWHTSTRGWYARMAPKSRLLVLLASAWLGTGAAASGTAALRSRSAPVTVWLGASVLAWPVLGWTAGRSVRHVFQDGLLIGIWSVVRAGRLWRELRPADRPSR